MGGLIARICQKYHYKRYFIFKSLLKNEGKNLLDIGCGPPSSSMKDGAFLNYLGYGQGMDIEPRNINFKFTLGNIEKIPFNDNTFDVVTASEVIEHIEHPMQALKEVHRILKPQGVFVMSTPNGNVLFKAMWGLWQVIFGSMWKDTHLSEFDRKTWIKLINKSKLFKLEQINSILNMNLTFKMRRLE